LRIAPQPAAAIVEDDSNLGIVQQVLAVKKR
jgi:hypothetical protein